MRRSWAGIARTRGPQRAVLPAAYPRAGIDPADIQFIEGHGAATATDDLAELSALLEVFGPRGYASHRCALGSVSAIIGDTRAAAGIAGLLKTAFAMTADVIPPSTGCVRPNPLLLGAGRPSACHPRPSSGRRPRSSWRPSTAWAPPLTQTRRDRVPSTSCCAASATSPTARAAGVSHPCCLRPPGATRPSP